MPELNALANHVFEFAVHDIVGVQLRNTATVGGSIYKSLWFFGRALGIFGARFVC